MAYTFTWAHGVDAGEVASFQISQTEGDFASLSIVIKNPYVGFLSGGVTGTLSRDGTTIFVGRLIGVPENMHDTSVQLVFVARPDDYVAQKTALFESYKNNPTVWDPVFVPPDQRDDPETLFWAWPAIWYTNPTTHEVAISGIVSDGATVVVSPDDIEHGSIKIGLNGKPQKSIRVDVDIRWGQTTKGEFNVTQRLIDEVQANTGHAGIYGGRFIRTMTGQGLMSGWPQPGSGFGGGWIVSKSQLLEYPDMEQLLPVHVETGGHFPEQEMVPLWGGSHVVRPVNFNVVFGEDGTDSYGDGTPSNDGETITITGSYPLHGPSFKRPNHYGTGPNDLGGPTIVGFRESFCEPTLWLRYDADRERAERFSFTLVAGVQAVSTDDEDPEEVLVLSSSEVDQKIDRQYTGLSWTGMQRPIRDVRRNEYISTPRGQQSLIYIGRRAATPLIAAARCVLVSFTTTFTIGLPLTLRNSISITHATLPGGTVTGKVTSLNHIWDPNVGRAATEVVIACMIGDGSTTTLAPIAADYVDSGYVDSGYQTVTGDLDASLGDIVFGLDVRLPPEGVADPINLFRINQWDVEWEMEGLILDQQHMLFSGDWFDSNEAMAALNEMPTVIRLTLPILTGEPAVTVLHTGPDARVIDGVSVPVGTYHIELPMGIDLS